MFSFCSLPDSHSAQCASDRLGQGVARGRAENLRKLVVHRVGDEVGVLVYARSLAGERGLLDLERGRERLDDAHVRGDLVPDRDLDDVAGNEVSRVDRLQCAGAQNLRDTGPPPSAPDCAVHGGAAEEWVGCAKLHLGLIGVEGSKSIDGSLCR